MGWLQQLSARLGLRSTGAPPATDLLVTFEGGSVSADAPVHRDAPRAGVLRPGDRIFGDYKINRLLGAGGFGEVYLAEMEPQARAGLRYLVTGVPFALKRVRTFDPSLVQALRHELRTWGELPQHPNLLRYRFFRVAGEELYIASEYAKGGSLADRLGARALSVSSVIDLGIQITWGLAALHEAGFLHGDLKPSNVLLDETGAAAWLCDYGLSLRLATGDDNMRYRFWDVPRGHTPIFASPEQARGNEMEAAADVWSLGALLLAAAAPEAAWSDWHSLRRGVQGWVDGLPASLARVILTALQEEVSTRASLANVESGLYEAWTQVTGESYDRARPAILPAPKQELSEDWYDARSIALRCSDPLFDEINAEEAKETPDQARLERLNELMMMGPQDMTAISVSAGRTTIAQDVKILEMLEGSCAVYRGLIREGRIDLIGELAQAARALSDYHKRRGDFQAAADAVAQIAEGDIPAVTTDAQLLLSRYDSLREAAVSLDTDGRPEEALVILDRATQELGAALRLVSPGDATLDDLYRLQFLMLTDRGVALDIADRHEEAFEAIELAFAFESELHANGVDQELIKPKFRASALVQRANALDRIGRSHQALADYERAIAILEAVEEPYAVAEDLESAKLNMGVTLIRLDDTDRAIPLLEAVVAARAARLAPRVEDAERWFRRERAVGGDWEPRHRLAFAQHSLASAFARAGQTDRAKASAEQAHEIWKRLVEDEGHAQLGQYQYHAMIQVAMIGADDDE
jgi:serine/threonine protein kinase